MTRVILLIGVLLAWCSSPGVSQAGLVFRFAVNHVLADSNPIEIGGVGAAVPIQVYLQQTDSTTTLTDFGLIAADITVTFNSPAGIAAVTSIQGNPAFDDLSYADTILTATDATLYQATASGDVRPTDYPDRILLGTFMFTGLALGSTTIGVTVADLGDVMDGGFQSLAGQIGAGSATLTVTPEPSSVALSLLMIGAASVVTTYRRRRRRSEQGADAACPAGGTSL